MNNELRLEIHQDPKDIIIPVNSEYEFKNIESSESSESYNNRYQADRSRSPYSQTSYEPVKTMKRKIIKDVIVPSYFNDIQRTMKDRTSWRILSNRVEFVSKILTGLTTIVAFAAGVYKSEDYLAFIAGCLGTIALVCSQFAGYAKSESKKQTEITNKILTKLKIENIPDLVDIDKKS